MENSEKKNQLYELVIGIALALLGLGSIILAYILNLDKPTFAKAEWYIYVLYILGAAILFLAVCFLYHYFTANKETKKITVRQMTLIAFQSAITIVLYYFAKFNLPFFPPWLDIQVSEIPALITSFIYGPAAGALVIFIRFIVKLPGTMTFGVGELSDLILGLVLVIIAGSIYKKNRTIKGALIGSAVGICTATVVACFTNWLILIPAYVNLAGFGMDTLVGMMSYIKVGGESVVTLENFMLYYVLVGVVPFNLFRYIIVLVLTFILYKRTHWVFDKISNR